MAELETIQALPAYLRHARLSMPIRYRCCNLKELLARVTVLFGPPHAPGTSGRPLATARSWKRDSYPRFRSPIAIWRCGGTPGAARVPMLQSEGTPGESNGAFRSASRRHRHIRAAPSRLPGRGSGIHIPDSGAQSRYRGVVGHQRNTVPSWRSPTCCSRGVTCRERRGFSANYFCAPGSAQMKLAASVVDPEPR
jgi:hypothetical protein